MMLKLDEQLIKVNDWTFRVATTPNQCGTPLLMISGLAAKLELFNPLIRALGDEMQTIRFDIPGVNRSVPPPKPYRLCSVASRLNGLLDNLGYEKVDIIGVSWGGGVAQEFARRYPHRCRRLILAGTTMGAFMIPPRWPAVCEMACPGVFDRKRDPVKEAIRAYGGDLESKKEVLSLCAKHLHRPDHYQLLSIVGWTSIHWIWKLKMPVLILAGLDDRIVNIRNARIMKKMIQNSRLVTFDCGHLFLLTQVEKSAQVIGDFLKTE